MSTIVSPYPPLALDPDRPPPPDAQWWRLRLLPNEDGHWYVISTNPSDDPPTWVTWEFFDGHTTILDAGLDAPNLFRAVIRDLRPEDRAQLDVVCVGPPTPCPRWLPLTQPGDFRHPEEQQ